jgi:hypothetical protein
MNSVFNITAYWMKNNTNVTLKTEYVLGTSNIIVELTLNTTGFDDTEPIWIHAFTNSEVLFRKSDP